MIFPSNLGILNVMIPNRMERIVMNKKLRRQCIFLLSLFILLIGLLFAPDKLALIYQIFSPILYATILAYLLDALVRFFEKGKWIRRNLAVFATCFLLLASIALLFALIIPTAITQLESIVTLLLKGRPDVKEGVQYFEKLTNLDLKLTTEQIAILKEQLREFMYHILNGLTSNILNILTGLAPKALKIFTVFILSIYMLVEKHDLLARMCRMVHGYFSEATANKILSAATDANQIFKSFLIGKIIDCTIVAAILAVIFSIFSIPYAPLMGITVGLFNIIPYFGPIIGTVPVVIIILLINPMKALIALVIVLVVGQIDANFIDPKIVGNNTGVSAFWVITAVTIGGAGFGFLGLVFSVPCVILIKKLVEDHVKERLRNKGMEDFKEDELNKLDQKKIRRKQQKNS